MEWNGMKDQGLTRSLMKSSKGWISPVNAEASATVTLFTQWENEKGSPGIPSVNSLDISASDTAFLDVRSLSLQSHSRMWVNYCFTLFIYNTDKTSVTYISFSSCFRMNSFVCAVTLSTLLQRIRSGIFLLTTLDFVKMS